MVYPDFLNWHIFCSMQPTIPMWNTLPSTKQTLAKVGFPHINAHHTNIVGWEMESKRDIPERKTTLPKRKYTLARIACYSEGKIGGCSHQRKNWVKYMNHLLTWWGLPSWFHFELTHAFVFQCLLVKCNPHCFHISQFWLYCKRLLPPLIQVIFCFFVLFQDLQN
jgi:hypothetical protein